MDSNLAHQFPHLDDIAKSLRHDTTPHAFAVGDYVNFMPQLGFDHTTEPDFPLYHVVAGVDGDLITIAPVWPYDEAAMKSNFNTWMIQRRSSGRRSFDTDDRRMVARDLFHVDPKTKPQLRFSRRQCDAWIYHLHYLVDSLQQCIAQMTSNLNHANDSIDHLTDASGRRLHVPRLAAISADGNTIDDTVKIGARIGDVMTKYHYHSYNGYREKECTVYGITTITTTRTTSAARTTRTIESVDMSTPDNDRGTKFNWTDCFVYDDPTTPRQFAVNVAVLEHHLPRVRLHLLKNQQDQGFMVDYLEMIDFKLARLNDVTT